MYVCTCVSGSKVAVQRTKNMDDLEPTIAFDLSTLNRQRPTPSDDDTCMSTDEFQNLIQQVANREIGRTLRKA